MKYIKHINRYIKLKFRHYLNDYFIVKFHLICYSFNCLMIELLISLGINSKKKNITKLIQ